MKLRVPWFPIFGAIGALALVKVVDHYLGAKASLIVMIVLILLWGLVHAIYRKQINNLEAHLRGLSADKRAELLAQASPALRRDIEKRMYQKNDTDSQP